MINALAGVLPGLVGGSADLAPSNLTLMKAFGDFQKGEAPGEALRMHARARQAPAGIAGPLAGATGWASAAWAGCMAGRLHAWMRSPSCC